MKANLTPATPGASPDIDSLYAQLGEIEEREIHAIECGRRDLLSDIRREQIPLKKAINKAEGITIYNIAA